MVVDFAKLDFVKDWIDARWDHRHLNDYLEHPTAEIIAETFAHFVTGELHVLMYRRHWRLVVTVHESARTFARYEEECTL